MPGLVDELEALLRQAEDEGRPVRMTFDRGRDITHPCTFCATPANPHHRLAAIGRHPDGSRLSRPVCEGCWPLAVRLGEQLLAQEPQA